MSMSLPYGLCAAVAYKALGHYEVNAVYKTLSMCFLLSSIASTASRLCFHMFYCIAY